MTSNKTLEERAAALVSCNKGVYKSQTFPFNTWNEFISMIEEQQARIRELEAEPTEEEVEAAAQEIKNFCDADALSNRSQMSLCRKIAFFTLEAARKVRANSA